MPDLVSVHSRLSSSRLAPALELWPFITPHFLERQRLRERARRSGVERAQHGTRACDCTLQIGREARTNEREMRAGAEVLPLRPRVPPPDRVRRPSTVVYPSLLTQSKSNYPVSTVPSQLISARLRELALRQEGARTQDHATLCSAFSWRLFIVPWPVWPPRTLYVRLLRSLGTRPTTRTLSPSYFMQKSHDTIHV